MTGTVLIAGVGNIFMSDDGFGVEVAHRLADADLPDWARVMDYGIRGMHLAYDLANGADSAILIDAVRRGDPPGTVSVIEPDQDGVAAVMADDTSVEDGSGVSASPLLDAHGMQPDVVLGILHLLEDHAPGRSGPGDGRQILLVGCEPATVAYGIGLSRPVATAVDEAVRVVLDLVRAAASSDDHQLPAKEWSHVPRDPR